MTDPAALVARADGVTETSAATTAQRTEAVFGFLIGLLPFAAAVRLPPSAGFWGQWASVTVVLLWLASRPSAVRVLPWGSLAFIAVALWLLVQSAAGLSPMPVALLVAVALLAIAAVACAAARSVALTPNGEILVVGFAWGLLAAFALNAVAVAFGLAGYEWMWVAVFKVPEALPRAVGLIGQSNHLGALAVYALFAALTLRALGRLPAWLLWLVAAAAAVVCAASASRVALVVWAAATAFAFAWWRGSPASAARRRELLAVAALFAAIQLAWVLHDRSGAGESPQIARSADSGRGAMLRDAAALWARHPVLGVGHGNYSAERLHKLDGPLPAPHADHAHNLFAQAMAEWGSVGLAIVAAAFVYVLAVVWRRLRDPARRPLELLPAIWVFGIALHSLVEQPLWFAHFLLTFALMLGWLAQPAIAAAPSADSGARGSARIVILLVALVCGVAAWDFLRSQRIALGMLAELHRPDGAPALVGFAEVAEVEALTLFPLPARVMLARKLPLGEAAIEAKIAIARQAMDAVPNGETVARWAAFCAVGDRAAEAQVLLAGLATRNPDLRVQALDFLRGWVRADPRIAALSAQAELAGAGAQVAPAAAR